MGDKTHMYSTDEMHYTFSDISEMFDDGLDVGDSYWISEMRKPKPSEYFWGASTIVEDIQESMWEHVEDFSNGYKLEKGKLNELEELIKRWLDENTECPFMVAVSPEKRTLSVQDLSPRERKQWEEEQGDIHVSCLPD